MRFPPDVQRVVIDRIEGFAAEALATSTASAMASAAPGLTDAELRASAVVVDGSGVTQPVSAAALPLPAGAATQATLADILAKLIAAPATSAKQDMIIGHVDGIEGLLTALNALLPSALVGGRLDVNVGARHGRTPSQVASRITLSATTTLVNATAYVSALVIACSNAGTTWTLAVQNREGTPKILVPSFTLTVPSAGTPVVLQFAEPVLMTSGIDVVTSGASPGTVDVFAAYWQ